LSWFATCKLKLNLFFSMLRRNQRMKFWMMKFFVAQ